MGSPRPPSRSTSPFREEPSAPPWLGPPGYLWPRGLDRRQGSLRVEERAGNTDRCAKQVNLLQAVFCGIPMNGSTFSSENRGYLRQMGHGHAINRLSENV